MDPNMDVHDHDHQVDSSFEPMMNNFELHDFIDDPNFDQFINLIRGDQNEDAICNFGTSDLINDCFIDNNNNNHLLLPPCPPPPPPQINNNLNVYDALISSELSCFQGEIIKGDGQNIDNGGGGGGSTSSAATEANPKAAKTDRSKTLVSERRRRNRMKDKLYALRALVPNITKMDKASIIGDALSYVHDLQAQAKKLTSEVEGLEASLSVSENYEEYSINNNVQVMTHNNHQHIYKKILQVEMFQVEERGYYTKIVCNKGEGMAASLYRALESLTDFNVQNSNLTTVCENYLLTFTLNVKSYEIEINLQNMKLWVAGALLNQGFEFMPSFQT